MEGLVRWYESLGEESAYVVALDSATGRQVRDPETGEPIKWPLEEATPGKIIGDLQLAVPGAQVTFQARGPKGSRPFKTGPTITVPGWRAEPTQESAETAIAKVFSEIRNLLAEQRQTIRQLGELTRQGNQQVISMAQAMVEITRTSLTDVMGARVELERTKAEGELSLALKELEAEQPGEVTPFDRVVAIVGPEKIQELVGAIPELAGWLRESAEARKAEAMARAANVAAGGEGGGEG